MARLGRAKNCTTFGAVGMHRQPSSGGRRSFRTSASYSRNKCPYEVLNLPPKASKEQIKQTYYLLAKKLHPDVACPVNAPDAKDRFAEINQAYEVLKDHTQRWLYDSGQINSNGAARIHLYCKYTQDFKDALTHPRDHEISQCLSILAWLRVICTRQAEHLQTRGRWDRDSEGRQVWLYKHSCFRVLDMQGTNGRWCQRTP